MLKYVFAGIFIALAWALVLVFRETLPMWPAVVVTVAIVAGLAAYVLFKLATARRAAAAIEAGLRDQAARQNAGMRPDLRAEIAAMESQFNKAVVALKSSKLGRESRDALGVLPWYVMIGPPGSGKTTAIRNSGLKFPQGRAGAVRGVGGTRNCDWWMTSDAILLDTAGRWSTEDDDRDEWLAFLDLLKKTRPKKPINGMMVAVAADALQGTPDDVVDLAAKLRERIDEVTGKLEMVLPVYLVVTKCDLVAGFVETFEDLKDRERGEIWGFSLPLLREGGDDVEAVEQHWDELVGVLERHCMLRLGDERRLEARQRIFAFPEELESVRPGLVTLVENLFAATAFEDAPIMRGVYLTSGTQEGRPIDRVMASMAEAFGVRPRMAAPVLGKPKSYFLRDVFRRVVFPDKDVAVQSSRVLRKQRVLRWAGTIGALAVSSAFLILPVSSFLENRRFVSDCRAFIEKLARARSEAAGTPAPLSTPPLEAADGMAARLAAFATKGRPDVSLRFGLYPGERLTDPLRTGVEFLVLRPILEGDGRRLAEFVQRRGETDAGTALNALMFHLLMTQPKAADEPAPENDNWRERWVEIAAQLGADRYAALGRETATTRSRRAVENALRFYVLGFTSTADLIERRADVVSRVRATLLGTGDGDPLAEILRDPDMPRDVRLVDIVGGAVTVFQTGSDSMKGPSVPGAFTPEGWRIVKEKIERRAADYEHDENAWVLGAARKRTRIDKAAAETAYFRRYVDAWKAFLLALAVKEPATLEETRSLFRSLAMEKPLDAIWRNASAHLVFKDESLVDAAAGKLKTLGDKKIDQGKEKTGVKDLAIPGRAGRRAGDEPQSPEDVGREFGAFLSFGLTKPTGLEAYGLALAELMGAIGEPGTTPDVKAFTAAVKTQRVKLSSLIASYNQNGWELGLLEKILMPPLRGAEVAVGGATGDSANRKWCESIVVVYDQLLAGRYPFAGGRHAREARVADVDKFFLPKGGALWQYYDETLAADIEHPAGTSIYRPKENASVKYKPGLFAFLKRARELTDLLYSKDPSKIGIPVAIRIRPSAPYSKIVFESGGRKIMYINARERWEEIVWPSRGALFRFFQRSGEGELGYPDGEWALFRLIEDGKLVTSSDGQDYLSGAWTPPLGDGVIRADFRPVGLLRGFRGLDVPRGVVGNSSGCHR